MKTELKKLIQAAGGSITFNEFMSQALYHPQNGYYTAVRDRLGAGGDFITSPEITSLFGELLTLQIIELWQNMGAPQHFQLIEMGPGSGRLASDILKTAQKFSKFYAAISYDLVEISHDFRVRQEGQLEEAGVIEKACWHADLATAAGDGVVGIIFGNEFLDALPVHWLEQTEEGLAEIGVGLGVGEQEVFTTVLRPLSARIAADYFSCRDISLAVGMRTEIGLAGQEWVQTAGRVLQRGVLLLIDYGYPQKEYFNPLRSNGTLAGHLKHVRVDNPLENPGEMDLTAHVDFTAVLAAGRESGLELLGYTTQGWFLMGLGILERLEMLSKVDGADVTSLKEAVMRLILPEGMGETFKVMALGKDIGTEKLSGFRLNEQSMHL
jgi:SAM-dependent MidA family methyltransferase